MFIHVTCKNVGNCVKWALEENNVLFHVFFYLKLSELFKYSVSFKIMEVHVKKFVEGRSKKPYFHIPIDMTKKRDFDLSRLEESSPRILSKTLQIYKSLFVILWDILE